MTFTVKIWYRYVSFGEQEKDFEDYEVEAESEILAKRKALDMHKRGIPFKAEII